jgi:hypothetical protein
MAIGGAIMRHSAVRAASAAYLLVCQPPSSACAGCSGTAAAVLVLRERELQVQALGGRQAGGQAGRQALAGKKQ